METEERQEPQASAVTRVRSRYRGSRTLRRVLRSGFLVSPAQLARLRVDTRDVAIVSAMASGCFLASEIAEACKAEELSAEECARRLKDPVRCAWYSAQLATFLPHVMGIMWATLYQRALKGDVAAAKLLAERFDRGFRPTVRRETVTATVSVGGLAQADIQAELLRRLEGFTKDEAHAIGDKPSKAPAALPSPNAKANSKTRSKNK